MPKFLVVDGNSIMNRAFYGLMGSSILKTSTGIYTNAIFGFLNVLNRYLGDESYTHFMIAFDRREPTFRHEMYEEYKAGRSKMPEELVMQMPIIKEVLSALGINIIEKAGFEADDLIGSYAKKASNEGFLVTILTGDKDLFQLIDDNITVDYTSTSARTTTTVEYDAGKLHERYGIDPAQMVELKALMGDSSDNIPGVKGIGEKGAKKLIQEFGTIDEIYKSIEKAGTKRTIQLLNDSRENCYLSRELGIIKTDVELDGSIQDLEKANIDKEKLFELFAKLEFKSFIDRFGLKEKETYKQIKRDVVIVKDQKSLNKCLDDIKIKNNMYLFFDFRKIDGWYELDNISLFFDDSKILFLNSEELLKEILIKNENVYITTYDSKILYNFAIRTGILLENTIFDISLAAYLLEPDDRGDTIEDLYYKYFSERLECEQTDVSNQISLLDVEDTNIQNNKDKCIFAEALMRLGKVLEEKLIETKMLKLLQEIEIPVARVLAQIEFNGICVDKKVLEDLDRKLISLLAKLDKTIKSMAGIEFNLNSPKQLGEVLFERLKLPVIKKTKTGYSTNAEVLETLRGRHEIIDHILNYRQFEKLRSTYSSGLLSQISKDSKIYSLFNQRVAATGRISSQDPNLQNIPVKLKQGREFRKAFIASEGNIFIDADYSQIELRVLAHFSKDKLLAEVYKNDEDIHTQTALYIFNEENLDKITPTMRNSAKTINFSVVYGISAYSLSIDLGITRSEAQKYIDEYFEKYVGVKDYLDEVIVEARGNGYVKTLFGRIRYVGEINSSNHNIKSFWERVAMNSPIQGTAADIIKLAMIKVDKELKKGRYRAKIVLQVHDELVVDCPMDEKDEVIKLIRDSMTSACELDVPLKVDIKSGISWYETK